MLLFTYICISTTFQVYQSKMFSLLRKKYEDEKKIHVIIFMDCEQSISLSITSRRLKSIERVLSNNFYRINFALQFNVELSELEDANQCPSFSLSLLIS